MVARLVACGKDDLDRLTGRRRWVGEIDSS